MSLSSHGSNYWKNILPELNNILLSQLNYLKDGLDLYNSAKVSNSVFNGKAVYTDGNSTLYEYPCEDSDKIVLFIPSLINKSSILDLSESQSLLLRFQNSNVKPYLYNWGEPTDEEENFSIADYLNNRLLKVIDFITKQEKKKIILAGYCMGGLFALASYFSKRSQISGIITIATPWNFEVMNFPRINYPRLFEAIDTSVKIVPADFVKMLFYLPNWSTINQKFINFSKGKFTKYEFINVENWVNDGVNVSKNVMRECLMDLADKNLTFKQQWKVQDSVIDPGKILAPTLCLMATKDSIVPLDCTLPLAAQLANCTTSQIPSGHIGMIINQKYNMAEEIINWCNQFC